MGSSARCGGDGNHTEGTELLQRNESRTESTSPNEEGGIVSPANAGRECVREEGRQRTQRATY